MVFPPELLQAARVYGSMFVMKRGEDMATCRELISALESGEIDHILKRLYALEGQGISRDVLERVRCVIEEFGAFFGYDGDAALFSAPGRTEIGGNHTDHQHGHVLCGSIDLDVLACAAPNGTNVIRILSDGYPVVEVSLSSLQPCAEECSTPAAMVRGVAAGIAELGYSVAGFDARVTSEVMTGSGLSSSAAFEVLMGCIMNHFFCGDGLDAVKIAAIGQWAENVYFGKPCGLMDQIACASGGVVSIDFKNISAPEVENIDLDLEAYGCVMCIIDTGSCHADLTDDYADIRAEMCGIAAYFGKEVLAEVEEGRFRTAIPALRERFGDRAVLRALHFFGEDARALAQAQALKNGDFQKFLDLVRKSGRSSVLCLQNIWSPAEPQQQAVSLALAVGQEILDGDGAIRVHGGGFAGTVQAFVSLDKLNRFKAGMEQIFGEGSCKILHIRPVGGCVLIG